MRSKMLVATIAASIALTACGAGEQTGYAGEDLESKSDFARTVGACPGAPPEGADPFEVLSTPGAWFRLTGVTSRADKQIEGVSYIKAETELVGGDAKVVDASKSTKPNELRSTTVTADLTASASESGAELYAMTGFDGDPQEVIVVIGFSGDEFAVVGKCKYELFTAPIRERFGNRATEVVRSIIGADSHRTRELLGDEQASPVEQVEILNPGNTDLTELARLKLGTFSVQNLPASWTGPYTICTKIERGWSDCVDLSSASAAASEVSAYLDPKSPVVEVWLLDQSANLLEPLAKLARLTVPTELLGELGDGRSVDLMLSLPSDHSAAEAVRNPETAGNGVKLVPRSVTG